MKKLHASYASLPPAFYADCQPMSVSNPTLLLWNQDLADTLNLPDLPPDQRALFFSGQRLLPGSKPIAMAYSGHQFGHFSPQLGDGRALLLGEWKTRGKLWDIQLKGSGPTPFSRRGDGQAALGPVLREYLVSEAMHALGIPTTRSLAAVLTHRTVHREIPLPGAILTRVASSHIRIGTFEYFYARQDLSSLKQLADYVMDRYYPRCRENKSPYLAMFNAIATRLARLIPTWQSVGFIHGVMNTDNMSIAGETIDFGPCAFMDEYDPGTVYSAIDTHGRYAYANQQSILLWNLERLAVALSPLISGDPKHVHLSLGEALEHAAENMFRYWHRLMARKLGLQKCTISSQQTVLSFLDLLHTNRLDYTNTFRQLSDAIADTCPDWLSQIPSGQSWHQKWMTLIQKERASRPDIQTKMTQTNPSVIPRNHQIERVLEAAHSEDLTPFYRLFTCLKTPFELAPVHADLAHPPSDSEKIEATFCGT